MSDVNIVAQVGRLTRDAELKYLPGGTPLATFTVAVNKRQKKGDKWEDVASFFDCVMWGKYAEAMAKYMTKRKQVAIQGQLEQRRWEKDGHTRSKVEIVVATVQLLGGRAEEPRGEARAQETKPDQFNDDIPF